jgi:UDP-N-acetylenolpyruvoylglucosamine reductase, C-terminal domain
VLTPRSEASAPIWSWPSGAVPFTHHSLALVAHAGAAARDVVRFARRLRARVERRLGVRLSPEPVFWSFGYGLADRVRRLPPRREGRPVDRSIRHAPGSFPTRAS